MKALFDRHRTLLDPAVAALEAPGFRTAFPEVPSGKFHGESAPCDGLAASGERLGTPFGLPGPNRHPKAT